MINNYPLIPKEAFLFFPKEQQIFQIKNRKVNRIIYEGDVPYTPFEKQKIRELNEDIRKEPKNKNLVFFPQSTLLRFLQATKFNNEECIKELKKYKKWQQSILPLRLRPEIEDILKKGPFYMVGRDINFRPIIIVNVPRIIDLDLKQKVLYEAIGYFFTFIIENCMIQGQIQTWITIVDLGKVGVFSLAGIILDIISFLSRNFRARLQCSYLVNCPSSIKFLYGMAKKTLTQDQISKIHLQEEAQIPRQSFTNIFEEDIEKKYGGKHQEYTNFWPLLYTPPILTSNQQSRLISVKEYGQMYQRGQLKKKKINASLLEQSQKILKEEYEQKLMYMLQEGQKQSGMDSSQQKVPLKDEDYVQNNPLEYGNIPKPLDFGNFFE